MAGDSGSDNRPLDFQSLSVQVKGEVLGVVARSLQSDWQRQSPDWRVTHGLSVSVLRGGSRPQNLSVGQRVVARTFNGPLEFRAEGDVFSSPGLSLVTSGQQSRITLSEEISGGALMLAFTEVQRAAGLLPLHASVLSREGRTVAVSGPSGAGKSTVALRLSQRGWQVVAEDWAWFSPETLEVIGWDSGLRLHRDSLEHFAPELLKDAETDAHGKVVLSSPRLSGAHQLSTVFFLGAAPSASRVEFVRAVWGMVGMPLTPAARQATQVGVNCLLGGVPVEHADRDEVVDRLA